MDSSSTRLPDGQTHTRVWTPCDQAAFREVVRRYEHVSARRVKAGAELTTRARTGGAASGCRADAAADRILSDARHGRIREPSPLAARYHELCEAERALREELAARLARHPVGPWLAQLRGVGTMAAARLVARLDRERARRPSGFWSYCGLATVPARPATCRDCGARLELAIGAPVPADHADGRGGGRRCGGSLAMPSADTTVRVATSRAGCAPRAGAVEGAGDAGGAGRSGRAGRSVAQRFDQEARVACHVIGLTMVRMNGTYAEVYHQARERFRIERPGWSGGRAHLSALRVMEKRFLLDLWHVWPRAGGPSELAST